MSGIQDEQRPDDTAEASVASSEDDSADGPALEIDASAAGPAISDTKPPGRRDAIIRILIVVGVLFVVFGLILPRFIDYQQVIDTLQGLTLQDYLVVSVFGVITWIVTGAIFTMLIAGLGADPWARGLPDPDRDRGEHPARAVEHGRRVGRHPRLGAGHQRRDRRHPAVRDLRSAEPVRPDVRERPGPDRRRGAEPRGLGRDRL